MTSKRCFQEMLQLHVYNTITLLIYINLLTLLKLTITRVVTQLSILSPVFL